MAAVLDRLFKKYRNQNLKRGQINPTPEEHTDGKFGTDALRKNPNLPIFDNA